MLSRKTVRFLAELYKDEYSFTDEVSLVYGRRQRIFTLKRDELHDFLFDEEYEAWFLNIIKAMKNTRRPRELLEFIMQLHTGESLLSATLNWSMEDRKKLGQRYLKDLAESLLNKYDNLKPSGYSYTDESNEKRKEKIDELKPLLELDGYIFKAPTLYQVEGSVIQEEAEQNYLEHLIEEVNLSDNELIKHHMKNAEDHYQKGRWDDSIANSRKFLEAILKQIAQLLGMRPKSLDSPYEVRAYLQIKGLIEKKEKEAIAKVYGLLSETGSHPYIAEKDQARLMWHLALTFSQFFLLRFQGYQQPT